MPLYEYRCPRCGNAKELLRKAEERDDPVICEGAIPAQILGERHFVTCYEQMERDASHIAYPGFVDKRMAKDRGRTPIHHPLDGKKGDRL